MRLLSTHLHNVCQHHDTKLTFAPGITGIFGANGAGKSNLMKMSQASLTNDFSVNPGDKASNVRWGTAPSDYSAITSDWEHEGTRFSVTRGLYNMSDSLRVVGQPTVLTKSKEISAEVSRLVGLPKEIIDNFIFVEQWKIFEFMSARPSDRANTFAQLCNTGRAEQLWEAIGKRLSADQGLVASISDNSDEIRSRMHGRAEQIAALKLEISELKSGVLSSAEVSRLEQSIESATTAALLRRQLKERKAARDKLAKAAEERSQRASVAEEAYVVLEREREELQPKVDAANNALARERELAATRQRAEKLRSKIDKLVIPPKPKKPAGYADAETIAKQIAELSAEITAAANTLGEFQATGLTECPVCHTPVSELSHVLASCTESANKRPVLDALRQLGARCREYDRNRVQWVRDKKVTETALAAAKSELAAIGDIPDDPAGDFAQLMERFRVCLVDRKQALSARDTARQSSATTAAQLAEAIADVKRLSAQYKAVKGAYNELDESKAKLLRHRESQLKLATHTERLSSLTEANKSDTADLTRIAAAIKRSAAAIAWINDLTEWRKVVHRDMLPRLVANSMLEDLVDKVNDTIAEFDGPFYVSADDDLTFAVHKPNRMVERSDRLSGGEKVILAIAFRFAVTAMFAGEIGMMVLDEPTAGLDAANLDCLNTVLERISSLTRKRGQQLIVITHDRRLELVFDNVIEIAKAIE